MLPARDSPCGNAACFRQEARYKGTGLQERAALQSHRRRHSPAAIQQGISLSVHCAEPPVLPPTPV